MQRQDAIPDAAVTAMQDAAPPIIIPITPPPEEGSVTAPTTEKKAPEFTNVVDAYKAHMTRTVLHAVNREYHKPMNVLSAVVDGFYHEGKLQWKTMGMFASSLVIGGLSSIFSAKPAGDAARTIVRFIELKAGIVIPIEELVVVVFQAANVGEVVVIASMSAMKMLQHYLNKKDSSIKYLTYQKATAWEISKKVSRNAFNLLSALAANIPSFLLTWQVSLPLAILTSLASASISWRGMSNLSLIPTRIYPARKIEALYLHDQLETFLRLSLGMQNQILGELAALQSTEMEDEQFRRFYARLLNLAKPAMPEDDGKVVIQQKEGIHVGEEIAAKTMGVVGVTGQLTFMEAAGVGVAHLFPNPRSPEAITAGISMALLVLLPTFGFGYYGGSATGRSIISSNEAIARFNNPKIREAMKWLGNVVSALSGGAIFTLGFNAANDFTYLCNITGILENIIEMSFASLCFVGTGLVNGYYMLSALDEILIYFSERCGNKEIQRLYAFVAEMRCLHTVLLEMRDDSYLKLLSWKMQVNGDGNGELSKLLHSIFDERMSDSEYRQLQRDLNVDTLIIKDRLAIESKAYKTMKSYFDTYEDDQKRLHPGLRRRITGCMFTNCHKRDNEADVESGQRSKP